MPHIETAALLAESLHDRAGTIVLDEVEHLEHAPEAALTLSRFLRSLPDEVRVVLISRRDFPLRLGGRLDVGGVGRLEERELAFDVAEAAELYGVLDHGSGTPAEAVAAAGGWISGILFQAWRLPEHAYGSGGESGALNSYLAAEIMSDLSPALQWFLVATSVFDTVTADDAAAVGVPEATSTLATFRGRFLPLWTSEDGSELRCHPMFRQYLRRQLDESGAAAGVHRRHALRLLRSGRAADAVRAAQDAGDDDVFREAVVRAVPEALARGDVRVVAGWLGRISSAAIAATTTLTRAQLVVAVDDESWSDGARIADRLLVLLHSSAPRGELEPGLAGTIAACYSHEGRQQDAMTVLDRSRPGTITAAWRSGLGLDAAGTLDHYRDRSPDCGEVVDGMLHRFDLMHGRLGELVNRRPAPWNASRSSRVAALRASGRLHDAEELISEWTDPGKSPALSRMRVELLLDLGRVDEAVALLSATTDRARSASRYCEHLHLLLEAAVSLRHLDDIPRARRALGLVESDPTARQHRRVMEQLPLWLGLADLKEGRHESAQAHLATALDYMLAWDRQLHVPSAAVYLAEAAWHTGDEEVMAAAAAAALRAAEIQGSDHLLLQALREFPLVLSRLVDASPEADSPWHRLGHGLRPTETVPAVDHDGSGPTVRVHEMDDVVVEVDGRPVSLRLRRSVELLCFLALAAHRAGVARSTVLRELFDDRTDDSAQAYLRRALGEIRSTIGDTCLEVTASTVRWRWAPIRSDWEDLRRRSREASLVRGPSRYPALSDALATGSGVYLPDSAAGWATEVRREAADLQEELLHRVAETAYETGDLINAERQVRTLLDTSPYRESAWRLAMRIAGDLGDDDRVIEIFRSCRHRLAELSVEPARSTTQLLERLRR
ncbi:hypothetical protein GIS00_00755 [Nakamurella sp. YIM 132087]|uniref:Bacterial transcriptional activator domain-containing protein n=1 Tax=Nakamurella alba TaxID=2665158 RepID=A0A7K1FED9_9ACTN|nr:hypothetical protein [Nakamurella alba]